MKFLSYPSNECRMPQSALSLFCMHCMPMMLGNKLVFFTVWEAEQAKHEHYHININIHR